VARTARQAPANLEERRDDGRHDHRPRVGGSDRQGIIDLLHRPDLRARAGSILSIRFLCVAPDPVDAIDRRQRIRHSH
jgi:hypothetical protein